MGGQIAAVDSLHLDMRAMNQVVSFDAPRRLIRVQAGMTWRDLQDVVDPRDLSVKIMQSYSNFTIGGSVSVNCHGRYLGRGPLVNSVHAVKLVTAEGEVLELTRSREPELFRAVFGGYGGLGVIAEIELELEANTRIERVVQDVALDMYPAFFREKVRPDVRIVLHNADLVPPIFGAPRAISWITTDKPLTQADRLVPRGLDYNLEKNAIWAMTELPGGNRLRESIVDRTLLQKKAITWRNHEASVDTASLEPRTRSVSTYLLQEYFIPVENFLPFAQEMARILKARRGQCSERIYPPFTRGYRVSDEMGADGGVFICSLLQAAKLSAGERCGRRLDERAYRRRSRQWRTLLSAVPARCHARPV